MLQHPCWEDSSPNSKLLQHPLPGRLHASTPTAEDTTPTDHHPLLKTQYPLPPQPQINPHQVFSLTPETTPNPPLPEKPREKVHAAEPPLPRKSYRQRLKSHTVEPHTHRTPTTRWATSRQMEEDHPSNSHTKRSARVTTRQNWTAYNTQVSAQNRTSKLLH